MRFRFSSSIVVRDRRGRYLLIVNKNALKARGEVTLLPVGGKVAIDPKDESLFTSFGAVLPSTISPDPLAASPEELFWHKVDPPMTDLVFTGPEENADVFCGTFERY